MLKIRPIRDFVIELQEEGLSNTKRLAGRVLGFVYLWRTELVKDRCPQRAASLTYTTLLAIFPLIAVIALLIPALFGGMREMEDQAIQSLQKMLIPTAGEQVEGGIRKYFTIFQENSTAVGIFGIIGLMLSAMALFSTVEKAFNDIWQARGRRSWVRIFSHFTTILVSVPILIGASIVLSAELTRRVAIVGRFVTLITPYLMTCMALTLAFYILPNTRVKFLYALIGGFTAGLLWEVAKLGFGFYVANPKMDLFFKSLGAIPIFLIWIYFSWLIVLVGCELAFLLQHYGRLQVETFQRTNYTTMDSKLVFLVFMVIADHFQRNQGSINFAVLTRKIPLKVDEMEQALKLLQKARLIKETMDGEFILSRPLESLKPADVLALGFDANLLFRKEQDSDLSISQTVGRLQESVVNWSMDKSLRDLFPGNYK